MRRLFPSGDRRRVPDGRPRLDTCTMVGSARPDPSDDQVREMRWRLFLGNSALPFPSGLRTFIGEPGILGCAIPSVGAVSLMASDIAEDVAYGNGGSQGMGELQPLPTSVSSYCAGSTEGAAGSVRLTSGRSLLPLSLSLGRRACPRAGEVAGGGVYHFLPYHIPPPKEAMTRHRTVGIRGMAFDR